MLAGGLPLLIHPGHFLILIFLLSSSAKELIPQRDKIPFGSRLNFLFVGFLSPEVVISDSGITFSLYMY